MKRILMIIGGAAHPFERCAPIFKEAMEKGGQFSIEVTEDRAGLADPAANDAVVMDEEPTIDLTALRVERFG